jgi:hypothetical protein
MGSRAGVLVRRTGHGWRAEIGAPDRWFEAGNLSGLFAQLPLLVDPAPTRLMLRRDLLVRDPLAAIPGLPAVAGGRPAGHGIPRPPPAGLPRRALRSLPRTRSEILSDLPGRRDHRLPKMPPPVGRGQVVLTR